MPEDKQIPEEEQDALDAVHSRLDEIENDHVEFTPKDGVSEEVLEKSENAETWDGDNR
jgi:tetrahydromethanopterin S-methyltransferase subunit G